MLSPRHRSKFAMSGRHRQHSRRVRYPRAPGDARAHSLDLADRFRDRLRWRFRVHTVERPDWRANSDPQILRDLLGQISLWAGKEKRVFHAFPVGRENDEVFGEKSRFVSDGAAIQLDRLSKWPTTFSSDEGDVPRLLFGGDERPEKVRRNSPASAAQ